mmetsp:Transcript_13140/g.18171  ORF Transcript_13140/g.18171 Transcript_13140/m.18171 type:complete len:278 (-) Transcript_13140:117-950(-)|eukprot:CAMPEP_0184478484 /NCGR_PEP_ID=MMETSP0113_2-20130426/500_1 /TAXON_ID=91329 /ORGANISM="Norrisiella sphaerica, Strain BC52" /LENGTH=277 /DNA_ID=CAMNT_0026856293 /DNA_START=118 /DNA_END=951 /DNA_ORIENTATION=+
MTMQRLLPQSMLFVVLFLPRVSFTFAEANSETQSTEVSTDSAQLPHGYQEMPFNLNSSEDILDEFEDDHEDVDLLSHDEINVGFGEEVHLQDTEPRTHDYIVINEKMPFNEANHYCKTHYEGLAILRKKEKFKYFLKDLKKFPNSTSWLWIGAKRRQGQWRWTNANNKPFVSGYVPNYCSQELQRGWADCMTYVRSIECIRRFNCRLPLSFVCQVPVDPPEEEVDPPEEEGNNKNAKVKCRKKCTKAYKKCARMAKKKSKTSKKLCRKARKNCQMDC